MENAKIKYFLYARKSSESDDRQVASIDSQVDELKKIAEHNGLEIVEVLPEAKSAKDPGRPVFNKMLDRISKGEANGILCWKLDRLARNPVDGGAISWMLQKEQIKHIQTYGGSYCPTDNVILMSVEFGGATQFIKDLSQNTKRGMRAKANNGWLPRGAPIGYLNNKFAEKNAMAIIKDPDRFELVKKAWKLLLNKKYSVDKMYQIVIDEWKLRRANGQKPSRSRVYEMFKNPFYYGYFEWDSTLYKGKHDPMITMREFKMVQEILENKSKPYTITHEFAFTGLVRCGECGAMITAEEKTKHQKNGNTHHYTYYHCTKRKNPNCNQGSINKKEIESQIKEILGKVKITPSFHEWAMGCIKEENKKQSESQDCILNSQQKDYTVCVKKLAGLIDMRANGELTEAEFLRRKIGLNKDKLHLEELMKDTSRRIDDWVERAENLFSFAETAQEKFEKGGLEAKRQILSGLGSNLFLKDGKLSVDLQKPFLLMERYAKEVQALHERLEPVKNHMNTEELEALYTKNPVWGG